MTRQRLNNVVKEWEGLGLIFHEYAFVTRFVLPGEPKTGGLHGVLRNNDTSRIVRQRLKEAIAVASRHDMCLFATVGLDESKHFWGGEYKFVYVLPDEAEIALFPKEVVQEITSKSEQLQGVVSESFSFYQEDENAVKLVADLRQIAEQMNSFMENSKFSVPMRTSAKKTRALVREIILDDELEDSLREQLDGPLQHEAATTICEGIRFLHAFR
jgi:hypothetical protein